MTDSLTDHALVERLPAWGVLLLESHHSPQFTMESRTHAFLKVVYVLRGEGQFFFAERALRFSAGDVVVVPPATANRIQDDPGSESSLYIGCLSTLLMQFDETIWQQLVTQQIRGDGHFAHRVATLMRRMVYTQQRGGEGCSLAMVADALQLVRRILDAKRFNDQIVPSVAREADDTSDQIRMKRYVDALETDFFEATTIDAAATELGMPRRTFTKLFAEVTGQTWLEHVRTLSIGHAKVRLAETELPIASVAFECGFGELSTFYRQFKRRVGISPAAFRRSV